MLYERTCMSWRNVIIVCADVTQIFLCLLSDTLILLQHIYHISRLELSTTKIKQIELDRASTKQYVPISCTLTTCYLIGGTLFQLIQIHFRICNLGSITIKKMVFFCCDGCGETFKKAKVDQHAAKCRECYAVSW